MTQQLRAWWSHRQGLDGALAGASAAEVLARTGWARAVGGSGSYLTLFARAGLSRAAIDAAAAGGRVRELPSARGCTYVLPAADFAVGLTVGTGAPAGELAAAVTHLGVTENEIDELCAALVQVLDAAPDPLGPAALKKELGAAVRSLGEAGKKRGTSTTLPLALGLLQARGQIFKIAVNGRFDEQRFGYRRWSPSPLAAPLDADSALATLAERYFTWAAPASLKHFRWFAGCTAAAAKQAVAGLELVPIGVGDLLLPAVLRSEFEAFTAPREPQYALVSWIDGIHLLHRELTRLLDPSDAARPEPASGSAEKRGGRTLGDLADPPCQIIVDRGRIVGLWEYDPGLERIVHQLFIPADDAVLAAVARTEEFIREQLGDARGMSLDSPAARAPRIAALAGQ